MQFIRRWDKFSLPSTAGIVWFAKLQRARNADDTLDISWRRLASHIQENVCQGIWWVCLKGSLFLCQSLAPMVPWFHHNQSKWSSCQNRFWFQKGMTVLFSVKYKHLQSVYNSYINTVLYFYKNIYCSCSLYTVKEVFEVSEAVS